MTPGHPDLAETDALVVVDVQRDFCEGGALAVDGANAIIPVLNRWIQAAQTSGATVAYSRDWHPPDHVSFAEHGGPWPEHCVRETPGASFHPDLIIADGAIIVSKGEAPGHDDYSAFQGTSLAPLLRDRGVRRLRVGGLALDVCVRATVLDGLKAGFEVRLIPDATRAVDLETGDGSRALNEMRAAGAIVAPDNPPP